MNAKNGSSTSENQIKKEQYFTQITLDFKVKLILLNMYFDHRVVLGGQNQEGALLVLV